MEAHTIASNGLSNVGTPRLYAERVKVGILILADTLIGSPLEGGTSEESFWHDKMLIDKNSNI